MNGLLQNIFRTGFICSCFAIFPLFAVMTSEIIRINKKVATKINRKWKMINLAILFACIFCFICAIAGMFYNVFI